MAVAIGWAIGEKCGRKIFDRSKKMIETCFSEQKQSHPYLASQLADIAAQHDLEIVKYLKEKKRPAHKAAAEISKISKEKREIAKHCKSLQYQLDFYEYLFPWLEDFKKVPIDEAIEYAGNTPRDEYEIVRKWLSPKEYNSLANAEKFQLALDRWKDRKKSAWDVGIDFERYIGYQLEQKGYNVKYFGATLGLEDMGRDLLATKDSLTLVIQCKRWAKEKTIHEKHICQLYGSVAVLASQNPNKKYKGVFITTTTLSDVSKLFADYSGIAYVENCTISDYPMIKCNTSKSGEKIYHLPFDQQYDKVELSKKKNAFYAWTTKEAENAGFRRAYKWHPEKSQ